MHQCVSKQTNRLNHGGGDTNVDGSSLGGHADFVELNSLGASCGRVTLLSDELIISSPLLSAASPGTNDEEGDGKHDGEEEEDVEEEDGHDSEEEAAADGADKAAASALLGGASLAVGTNGGNVAEDEAGLGLDSGL